jgi:hypothetical protein
MKAGHHHLPLILVPVVLVILAYSCVLDDFFLGEDYDWLRESERTVENPAELFTSDPMSFVEYFRPVVHGVFLLEYLVFGLNASGYYAFAILLHILNCLFVFRLAKELMRNDCIATISSSLFAVSWVVSEAPTWISSVTSLLLTFFYLLTLLLFIRKRYNLAIFTFILALLSKESAVTLVAALLLYEFFFRRKDMKLKTYVPFAAITAVYLAMQFFMQQGSEFVKTGAYAIGFHFFENIMVYLIVLLVPVIYPLPLLFMELVVAFLTIALLWKGTRELRFLTLWLYASLISVSFFLTMQALRFLYLPAVPFFIIFGALVHTLYVRLSKTGLKDVSKYAVGTLVVAYLIGNIAAIQVRGADWDRRGGVMRTFMESLPEEKPTDELEVPVGVDCYRAAQLARLYYREAIKVRCVVPEPPA